ncbi:beta-hexosaminidase [Apiospora hydei]|uniref:beta-N-acetylhexosaminidase n=1 Tax=Apiospora hydei TaxID=1337664 RepID=A0ABR1VXK4_9PEZI
MRAYSLWSVPAIAWLGAIPTASRLIGIPTVPFQAADEAHLALSSLKSIIVDTQFADVRDETGETLIPPTLHDFSEAFATDLKDALGLELEVSSASEADQGTILLTLGNSSDYLDAAGAPTSEGYTLSVSADGVTVRGASPLGVWWGTRTVLQQAILNEGSLPHGEAHDAPGWATRGMMLDAGRHYYPPEFITEMCAYMSFFKQNTLHLHLSDNFNVIGQYSRAFSLQLFARFRLWSDSEALEGLNKYKNESYTREQFEQIQSACAARGVTVLPEIEAPGHALAIVQWKPQLGLANDLSLLNISHPETSPTMKTIWAEFLPWFHSKTVHIGADEYTAGATEYNRFVNEMSVFIAAESGKAMRIWGTFPPRPEYGDGNVHENVSIQHWAFFEDNPLYDYLLKNYSVLNSDDSYYVVSKWSGSYPQAVDIRRTFRGDPATGGLWYPHIFDQKNATNNPASSNSRVMGSVAPLWNDYGQNASVVSEAYYAWREGIPALGDKQWGGDLSESEFTSVLDALHPKIPGQNLERSVPSESSKIVEYDFSSALPRKTAAGQTQLEDSSGNGYHASTDCPFSTDGGAGLTISSDCTVTTPLSSKGRGYTLSLELRIDELADPTNATLLSGGDSVLMLTPSITLFASGTYYRLNSTIPLGGWVNLSIVGKGGQTFASVKALDKPRGGADLRLRADGAREEFLAVLGVLTQFHVWAPVAIEAPLAQIGGENSGWSGQLRSMSLTSEAI